MSIKGGDLIAAISGGVFEITDVTAADYMGTSPAVLIASLLVQVGNLMSLPSSKEEWPMYVAHLPDLKANSGVIYDTAGLLDGRLMKTGEVIEHYGLEIHIRSNKYDTGFSKINELANALDLVHNITVDVDSDLGFQIVSVNKMTPATYAGLDEERRFNFTTNYCASIIEV